MPPCRTLLLALPTVLFPLLLAGCATSPHSVDATPPVAVSAHTWRQVDGDIGHASRVAAESAENFARGLMESWMQRVQELGDEDFIPWYTSYWTQQWLSLKVAWYRIGSGEGDDGDGDGAVRRLAAYLQEQYQDRVVAPACAEIDPNQVMAQATTLYVVLLGEQLQGIPRRYGLSELHFDRRLRTIPAIAPTATATGASLYQLLHSQPVAELPAYAGLLAEWRASAAGVAAGPADDRMSPVATRAAERLVGRLAFGGGASVASAAAGGVAGVAISLAATLLGAVAHAQESPQIAAQLSETLSEAHAEMWQQLVEDRAGGVLAGISHIAGLIEHALARTRDQAPSAGSAAGPAATNDTQPLDGREHGAASLANDDGRGGG